MNKIHEALAARIVREAKGSGAGEFKYTWKLGRWEITVEKRSKSRFWGRFGGGWNWKLGFMAGGSTVIFNLLILAIRVCRKRKEAEGDS